MIYFRLIFLFNLILFFYSCSVVQDGFTNQKKNNNDEFMVEKKSPLIMPPDYDQLPIPNENSNINKENNNNVKELIEGNDKEVNPEQNIDLSTKKVEDILLDKIKSN